MYNNIAEKSANKTIEEVISVNIYQNSEILKKIFGYIINIYQ